MAVIKPLFINQVEYDAESERRGFAGLVAQSAPGVARTGVLGAAPSVSLSGSAVQVGPFNAVIGSAKGAYLLAVDSVTPAEGTVVPADATNGRLDRVVLEVLDPDNGSAGTTRTGRLRVISGTAAAIPALPVLPPLSLHVGQVQVPKSGAGSPVVTVDCQFTAAAGAPVPVRSEAERDALGLAGPQEVTRLDNGGRDFVFGGQWVSGVVGVLGSSGWSVSGVVESAPIGGTRVRQTLTLKLGRSAGSFDVGNSSGFVGLTGAILPVDCRPSDVVDMPISYVSSAKSWGGNAVLRVTPGGTISILPTAPTTSIYLTQGGYFSVSASWVK